MEPEILYAEQEDDAELVLMCLETGAFDIHTAILAALARGYAACLQRS
jgi:hypothetical protein